MKGGSAATWAVNRAGAIVMLTTTVFCVIWTQQTYTTQTVHHIDGSDSYTLVPSLSSTDKGQGLAPGAIALLELCKGDQCLDQCLDSCDAKCTADKEIKTKLNCRAWITVTANKARIPVSGFQLQKHVCSHDGQIAKTEASHKACSTQQKALVSDCLADCSSCYQAMAEHIGSLEDCRMSIETDTQPKLTIEASKILQQGCPFEVAYVATDSTFKAGAGAPTARFIPHPFNNLQEYWMAPDTPHMIDGNFITTGHVQGTPLIKAAARQGMYVPIVNGTAKPLKLFSAKEARDCLAHKKVLFAGDSYQSNFFIGMVDVLLDDIDDTHIQQHPSRVQKATERTQVLANRYPELAGIQYGCSEASTTRQQPAATNILIPHTVSTLIHYSITARVKTFLNAANA
eukprot:SAG11_NODE_3867_length_2180_cov_71.901970_3_plen_400_part_00